MGTAEIVTAPHEITVNGTTVLFKADPTGGQAWRTLMNLKTRWRTEAQQQKMHTATLDALATLAQTQEDADTLRSLFPWGEEDPEVGTVTLRRVGFTYVELVTGFRTPPPSA
jgi:hypothetical protein